MSMRNDSKASLISTITEIKQALMNMRNDPEESLPDKHNEQRYHTAEEADRVMGSTIRAEENNIQALAKIQESNKQLMQANIKQAETIAAYWERISMQDSLATEQAQEISALGEQLSFARNENISQSEKIVLQNVQLSRLQTQINGLEEQLSTLETQNTYEIRSEAVRKADELMNRAIADSDRIISQATEQKDRLIAACRAAYYSALQFKQELAEQFKNIERELDESIDVLQFVNNNHMSLCYIKEASEPASQQENRP